MTVETTSTKKVKVTNRNNGRTGYKIQNGVRRVFEIGQSMNIDLEELEQLQYEPGGDVLLRNYFIIEDAEALENLNIETEPEYFYTEKEITELLKNGSLDQLEDCLNFGPAGVIDLLKDIAVEIELPDMRKRKLIYDKTNFSVDNAIRVRTALADGKTEKKEEVKKERKADAIKVEDNKPARKSAPISAKNII